MEKKYKIPEGMLKAFHHAENHDGTLWDKEALDAMLLAAIKWLAENPIVPTDAQADELWHHPKTLSGDDHYAKAMARDWQRRMFLAPPEPEIPSDDQEQLDTITEQVPFSRKGMHEAVEKAYLLGKNSKERT